MKAPRVSRLPGLLPLYTVWLFYPATCFRVDENPYRHREIFGQNGEYILECIVDRALKSVTFNVTVETTGYVGFGLSDNGKMSGANIVIGGVFSDGKPYFSDMHAVGSRTPEVDQSQDWRLEEAWENATHTFLRFSRDFDTCNTEDYLLTEDKLTVIWAYGEEDELLYHHGNRGAFNVYLLNPEYAPEIVHDPDSGVPSTRDPVTGEEFQVWTIHTTMTIPSDDTFYWCTIHKAPELSGKHHVIGLQVEFPDDQSGKFIHHMFTSKCNAPRGSNRTDTEMFSNFVSHRGQNCLSLRQPTGPMPTEYCTELFMGWAVGGRAFFNPPHVGFPLGNNPDEYYLLQIHYDNINRVSGQVVDVKLNFFYTPILREHDAGTINLRHTTPGRSPSLLVPPNSIDHKIFGLCGGECTENILPSEGIRIYALIFHSHNSGRKMKLHHFRGNRELSWVASDDNFGFDYQQRRVLAEERLVLPGDELVIECEYDNTWTNGTVVGGYSSRQEMCVAFIFYYNKILDYQQCSSEIESPVDRRELLNGVEEITWSNRDMEFLVDDEGSHLKGMRISEVSDEHVKWNGKERRDLQRFQLEHEQVNWCYPELFAGGTERPPDAQVQSRISSGVVEDTRLFAKYPSYITAYTPEKRICKVP